MTASTAAGLAFVLPVLLLAGAGACTSFSADDSGSGTTSDAAPGTTTDGAPSGVDAGGAINDFCSAHRSDPGFVYCNDFELPTAASKPYGFGDATATPMTTSVAVLADGTRSAVLKASVNASAPGTHEIALGQHLEMGVGAILPLIVDIDVKILVANEPSVTAAAIHIAGTSCEGEYGLGVFDGTTVGETRNRQPTPQPFVAGEWKHLTISVLKDAASASGYRELTRYGDQILVDRDARQSNGTASFDGCAASDLVVGIAETQQDAASITVLFDNILVRKPQ